MLTQFLRPKADVAYTLLRVVSGLMFSFHGMQKIFLLLPNAQQPPIAFGTQMWFGGIIELTCGLAIALGIFTSCAAFLASGTMAVAYVQFHWKLQFDAQFFPGVNQGEAALLYSFLFLYIACRGSGKGGLGRGRAA